ncbi:MAG: hypothetical protein HY791_16410 [Deltaproteobacteria bacterium]|nr:hypothetical protein [Deltaproteobacteria bacterium]
MAGRACGALLALLVTHCAPAPFVVDDPTFDPSIRTVVVLVPSDRTALARAGAPGDSRLHFRVGLSQPEGRELFSLGWRCPDLEDLGLGVNGLDQLIVPASPVRGPDTVHRAVLHDGEDPAWETLDEPPAALSQSIGLSFTEPTPCHRFRSRTLSDLVVRDRESTFAVLTRDERILVGFSNHVFEVLPDETVRELTITASTSAQDFLAAQQGPDGRLYVYASGKVLAGDAHGGEFEVLGSNPAFEECSPELTHPRQFAMDGRVGPAGYELVIVGDTGTIDVYEVERNLWRRIEFDPPLVTLPVSDGSCPVPSVGVAFSDGGIVAAFETPNGLRWQRAGDTAARVVSLPVATNDAPTHISKLGSRVLVGTNQQGVWSFESGRPVAAIQHSNPGAVKAILSLGDGFIAAGGSGPMLQWFESYGACEDAFADGVGTVDRMLPFGDAYLAIPMVFGVVDENTRRPASIVEIEGDDPCLPHAR